MNRMVPTAAIAAFAICGAFALQPAFAACASGAGSGATPMGGGAMSPPHEAMKADMERHHEEMIHSRLAHLADRLEIKASQQGPWQKFSAAFTEAAHSMAPGHDPEHWADKGAARPDAATIARMHADHAARHAQALAKLADATAELQSALGPDQRKVLDEVTQRYLRGLMGHGEGPGAYRMMHGPMHGADDEECEGPGMGHHEPGHPGDHAPHGEAPH
jgi:hypothetical protein